MNGNIRDKYYRFIFENSFDAILLSSLDGAIYRANAAACEMFQRSEEELCRIGHSGIVDRSDPRLEQATMEREAKGKVSAELNFTRKDGSVFPAVCASAIFKDDEEKTWVVIIIHDITTLKDAENALRKANEETAHFAAYDYLTGILNRRVFIEKLQQEMERSKRDRTSLSLLLLDIDRFKQINDTLGHTCGDIVLKDLAHLLTENLRPYDVLGRFGGDEFMICMPNTTCEEASTIAERLRSCIEHSEFSCDINSIKVTISIGFDCFHAASCEDADSFITKVDENMYHAKKQRNCVFGVGF